MKLLANSAITTDMVHTSVLSIAANESSKMKKISLLLTLFLILASCKGTRRLYTNQELGFSFGYPRDWECHHDEFLSYSAVVCKPTTEWKEGIKICNHSVSISADPWDLRTHTESTTARELLTHYLEVLGNRKDRQDADIGDILTTQVGGEEAAFVDVRRNCVAGNCEHSRYVFVYVGSREVRIVGNSLSDEWESFSPVFDAILDSMTFPPSPTPVAVTTTHEQSTVNAVSDLIRPLRVPDHLLTEDAVKTSEDFDVNEYFSILDHLSMPEGYTLDYIYHYDVLGGEPYIYARPVVQPPYRTFSEYADAKGGPFSWDESLYGFIDSVQTDGAAEGFFQFIVLRTMGSQFYQYWHAAYNDNTIICDHTGLEVLLGAQSLDYRPPLGARDKARKLDFESVVEFEEDTVLVRVVIFTAWGGFIEESYTIRRSFPHEIINIERKTLVEYNCGIDF